MAQSEILNPILSVTSKSSENQGKEGEDNNSFVISPHLHITRIEGVPMLTVVAILMEITITITMAMAMEMEMAMATSASERK